jgi:hypothetical protein
MKVVNETPFAVSPMLWEDMDGQGKLTVVVKVTFEIREGKVEISENQLPILTVNEYYENNPLASVRYEADNAFYKPFTDVVLVGKAHAPNGQQVTELDVTLKVGALAKTIRVFGNRKWLFPDELTMLPMMSRAEKFLKMDLTYERAFGGRDRQSAVLFFENPVGRGFVEKKTPEAVHNTLLPNLEDPRDLIKGWDSRPHPVGFGFFARGWFPRYLHAGTYDEKYHREQAPRFPKDFSYAFYNAAHPLLQVKGYLKGNEDVELTNLCSKPHVRFQLPGIIPRISVTRRTVSLESWIERRGGEGEDVSIDMVPTSEEEIKAVLDTLVFVPEEGIFYEVFRGVCSVENLNDVDLTRITVKN